MVHKATLMLMTDGSWKDREVGKFFVGKLFPSSSYTGWVGSILGSFPIILHVKLPSIDPTRPIQLNVTTMFPPKILFKQWRNFEIGVGVVTCDFLEISKFK